MAVYKVIQDIEAEDKLIGPLGLKAFIYASIAALSAFIDFRLLFASALGPVRWLLILIFLVPMVLFGVLASPLGREQPTEVWLLARLKFLLKPRRRIWDQSGISQPVSISVPSKTERQLTNNLSQSEVRSRLQALTATLDSRGWAIKGTNVNLATAPGFLQNAPDDSERLVDSSNIVTVTTAPVIDIHPADDILDAQNNPTAQKFETMMQEAAYDRATALDAQIKAVRQELQSGGAIQKTVVVPGQEPPANGSVSLTAAEQAVLNQVHQRDAILSSQHVLKSGLNLSINPVTAATQAARLELAQSGNDLSVASIAKLANR